MAFIDIHPNGRNAEHVLYDHRIRVTFMLRRTVAEVFGVPESDIIVNLHRNTVIYTDFRSQELGSVTDVIVKISTSDTELKEKAGTLRDAIVAKWQNVLTGIMSAEIWISFFDEWGIAPK